MGIAAGLVGGGRTIIKTFRCSPTSTNENASNGVNDLTPANLLELRRKVKFHELALLVIDECGMNTLPGTSTSLTC
jgi:hypothetical protein